MVVERGPLDIGGGPAVVVDDCNPVAGLQHLPGQHLLRAVGVHHHHQGAVVHHQQCLLGRQKCSPVLGQLGQPVGQDLARGRAGLLDDIGGDPLLPGDGKHAGSGAHTIVIRGLVPHDKQAGGVGHQGREGISHDTAFHLGALLCLLGTASKKLKGELIADDGLITPAGQRHLDGEIGELHQLLEGGAVFAHADGQGGGQAAGIDHLVDGVQNVKFLIHEPGEILLLKKEEIPVPLHPPQHPAGPVHPGVQAGVDFRVDGGALVLREVFHQILIVVQQQHRRHRPAGLIAVPHSGQLGHIHPVGGGQKAAPPLAGPNQVSVY